MTHTLMVPHDGRPVDQQRRDERAQARERIAESRRVHDSKAVVDELKAKYGTRKARPSQRAQAAFDREWAREFDGIREAAAKIRRLRRR